MRELGGRERNRDGGWREEGGETEGREGRRVGWLRDGRRHCTQNAPESEILTGCKQDHFLQDHHASRGQTGVVLSALTPDP